MFNENIKTYREKRTAIKLLNASYRCIRDGHATAVCGAVSASASTQKEYKIADAICDEISERLGPDSAYVTTWLRFNSADARNHLNDDQGNLYARQYRLLWIKDMIREIKES